MQNKKSKIFLIISIFCVVLLTAGLSLATASPGEAAAGGSCGADAQWSFDEASGLLTISGSGAIYDYDVYDTESTTAANFAPWIADYKDAVTKIVIGEGITAIGNNAFSPCSVLAEVELPESLLTIGETAFADCDALTGITLPAAVTTLGAAVFADCDNLTAVNVTEGNTSFDSDAGVLYTKGWNTLVCYPAGITAASYTISGSAETIGDYAFFGSNYLQQVNFDGTITDIGICAFGMCEALTLFTVPDDVTVINEGAFMGCTVLENVVFPEGLTRIDNMAFAFCMAMTRVDIPDYVTNIGAGAFGGCTAMTGAYFGKSVEVIGEQAFASCTSLNKAYFYGDAPSGFGADVFADCADGFTIYYLKGTGGWTTPAWNGYASTYFVDLESLDGVKAVAVNQKVNISWNAVSGADGYEILVTYTDDSVYKRYYTTKTACNFNNLINGTEYIFKVRAYINTTEGKQAGYYAEAVSATPFDDTVQSLKGTAYNKKIRLSWAAVDGADGYYIYAMYGDDSKYKTYATTKTTCNFTKLVNGDTYKFKVREYKLNAAGSKVYGSYSDIISAVPQMDAITGLEALSSNQKIHVDWLAASGATSYYIYVNNADGSKYKTYSTTKTTCNFTNLVNDQNYSFKVRACYKNSAGKTCYGKYCSAVTAAPVNDTVQNLTATPYDSKIRLSWDAVTNADGYYIYAMYADGSKYKTYATTNVYCNFTKLANGNAYQFKIRSYQLNQAGGRVYGTYCPVVSAVPGN